MSAPRACVLNLGCRVNRVECDWMESGLVDAGCLLVEEEDADVVVVNTCAVTGEAEAKTRKAVRHAALLPRRPLVVVTGCSANLFPDQLGALGGSVSVCAEKSDVVRHALALWASHEGALAADVHAESLPATDVPATDEGPRHGVFRVKRGVKVQDGCDNRCTYCIVWKARGASRCLPYPQILSQVRRVLDEGAREVDLTGVNLGRYAGATEEGEPVDLASLIRRLAPVVREAGATLRASSVEPPEAGGDLADAMAENADVVAPHLHLPLQSGCQRTLERMGRRYTASGFLELVRSLREKLPTLSLTTDVIAGFPGETDEDFAESFALCEEAGFSKMHVFRYSARPGTEAASWPDQVPPEVSRARAAELRNLAARLRVRDMEGRLGSVETVLVERVLDDGTASGTTASFHDFVVPAGAAGGSGLRGPGLLRARFVGVDGGGDTPRLVAAPV